LLKRHEIQVLLKAGFSARDVAERSGTSVDTVRRVRREDEVQQTDDRTARAGRRVGRPSKAAPFASKVSAWLKADPNLPTQELLRRAKEVGYVGNYCSGKCGRDRRSTIVVSLSAAKSRQEVLRDEDRFTG
ncbi:MAG: helix-turn-helix domain-containing protein, partial [Rhodospirillales bacterium]|nr:helix-turn-helix domain-containing protein [Rhodospirillales bacterium]